MYCSLLVSLRKVIANLSLISVAEENVSLEISRPVLNNFCLHILPGLNYAQAKLMANFALEKVNSFFQCDCL